MITAEDGLQNHRLTNPSSDANYQFAHSFGGTYRQKGKTAITNDALIHSKSADNNDD